MQNRKRDIDVQKKLLDSVGEGEGGMFWENSMYIIYSETDHQPRLEAWDVLGPGALGRPRGEREVGGGIGMGNTCNSMADSCQCITKPTAMLWSN